MLAGGESVWSKDVQEVANIRPPSVHLVSVTDYVQFLMGTCGRGRLQLYRLHLPTRVWGLLHWKMLTSQGSVLLESRKVAVFSLGCLAVQPNTLAVRSPSPSVCQEEGPSTLSQKSSLIQASPRLEAVGEKHQLKKKIIMQNLLMAIGMVLLWQMLGTWNLVALAALLAVLLPVLAVLLVNAYQGQLALIVLRDALKDALKSVPLVVGEGVRTVLNTEPAQVLGAGFLTVQSHFWLSVWEGAGYRAAGPAAFVIKLLFVAFALDRVFISRIKEPSLADIAELVVADAYAVPPGRQQEAAKTRKDMAQRLVSALEILAALIATCMLRYAGKKVTELAMTELAKKIVQPAVLFSIPAAMGLFVAEVLPLSKAHLQVEDAELSMYFLGAYQSGGVLQSTRYDNDFVDFEIPVFKLKTDRIFVSSFPLDLRELCASEECDRDDLLVLYHYTDMKGFRNIANFEQTSAQIFSSLADERAHFGKGVYATQHEPAVWGSRQRVLLNNYSNGDPLRAIPVEKALIRWGLGNPEGHRAAFCIPMIVPKAISYNIFQRQTPELEARGVALGADYKGRAVHKSRDVFVVRALDKQQRVGHLATKTDSIIAVLDKRLAFLQESIGSHAQLTLETLDEKARRLRGRGRLQEAELLYRRSLEGRRQTFGDLHSTTLDCIFCLANLLVERGRFAEAELLFQEAREGFQQTMFGFLHPKALFASRYLQHLRNKREHSHGQIWKPGESMPMWSFRNTLQKLDAGWRKLGTEEQAEHLSLRRKELGEAHPETLHAKVLMATSLMDDGELGLAETMCHEALRSLRDKVGLSHPRTVQATKTMALIYQQRFEAQGYTMYEAERLAEERVDHDLELLP